MRRFADFSELDDYFCSLFSPRNDLFYRFRYKGIPVGVALQHNIYDYYRSFIFETTSKTPLLQKWLSKIRIYGWDHKLKLLLNGFLGRREASSINGRVVFFSDNFVPRMLSDFKKVMEEIDASKLAFCTTDYRAYKHVLKWRGKRNFPVLLIGSASEKHPSRFFVSQQDREALVSEFGWFAETVVKIIERNYSSLVAYYNIFRSFIKEGCPSRIVLASDGFSVARMLCFAAKQERVQTCVLQHGLIDSLNGYMPLVADKMLVWSENEKVFFSERGIPLQNLAVVGSPRFDIGHLVKIDESADRERHGLFVISAALPQDVCDQIDSLLSLAKKLDRRYFLTLRPHPYYRKVAEAYFNERGGHTQVKLDTNDSFLTSVSECGFVVFGDVSTGVFEALALRKKIYILDNEKQGKLDIYQFPRIDKQTLFESLTTNSVDLIKYDLSACQLSGIDVFMNLKSSGKIAEMVQNEPASKQSA